MTPIVEQQLAYGNGVTVWEVAQLLWYDKLSFLLVAFVVLIAVWLNSFAIFLCNPKRSGIKFLLQEIAVRSTFYFGLLVMANSLHLFIGKWEIKLFGSLIDIYITSALVLLIKELKNLVSNLIKLNFDLQSVLVMLDNLDKRVENKINSTLEDKDDAK